MKTCVTTQYSTHPPPLQYVATSETIFEGVSFFTFMYLYSVAQKYKAVEGGIKLFYVPI